MLSDTVQSWLILIMDEKGHRQSSLRGWIKRQILPYPKKTPGLNTESSIESSIDTGCDNTVAHASVECSLDKEAEELRKKRDNEAMWSCR